MGIGSVLLLSAGGVLLLLLSAKLLAAPLRTAGRVAVNALLGLGALLLLDAAAPLTGIRLGLNLGNSLTVGILGLPGLGLLLLLRWVLI